MPTFRKRPEFVDARQFTGGVQQGTDTVLWINSNNGKAFWHPERQFDGRTIPEHVVLWRTEDYTIIWINDWAMLHQDGTWDAMRPEDLHEEYEEV